VTGGCQAPARGQVNCGGRAVASRLRAPSTAWAAARGGRRRQRGQRAAGGQPPGLPPLSPVFFQSPSDVQWPLVPQKWSSWWRDLPPAAFALPFPLLGSNIPPGSLAALAHTRRRPPPPPVAGLAGWLAGWLSLGCPALAKKKWPERGPVRASRLAVSPAASQSLSLATKHCMISRTPQQTAMSESSHSSSWGPGLLARAGFSTARVGEWGAPRVGNPNSEGAWRLVQCEVMPSRPSIRYAPPSPGTVHYCASTNGHLRTPAAAQTCNLPTLSASPLPNPDKTMRPPGPVTRLLFCPL